MRAIKRADITSIRIRTSGSEVIPDADFPFRLVTEAFITIKQAMAKGGGWSSSRRSPSQCTSEWPTCSIASRSIARTCTPSTWMSTPMRTGASTRDVAELLSLRDEAQLRWPTASRPSARRKSQIPGPTDGHKWSGSMIADLGGADVCSGASGGRGTWPSSSRVPTPTHPLISTSG